MGHGYMHRALVIGLDTQQGNILFLVVFFVIYHSVPIHSMLYGQSVQCHVDMGEILSIRRFLFCFIHCFT